ncbi:cardiomyopathy-associated protein 5 isoform X2 [Antennarius striatus]|uniref:cardiomyopathy-associated protein 5 isoform X2 n=1 Tax=Antennarius striatus TaxID=241820 RepID=UPI0035B10B55
MDECESLVPEMTELQEFQCEASETISQDDEDEVEELHNSLREVVQDQSVKPKLQCLLVDPSFSMVTVQSEDSGIVWETASSRCSTPWASETSSVSEGYNMECSGAAGKITIVFDEEKIIRRRLRSGGRISRLSRPGSSRSASALGVERLEMAEVSIPNVKQEKTETETDLNEIKNNDQQLFSLISEGYEILNIRVPSKLPTVDEEESTELQDNLSYLEQTPMIRSRNHHDQTWQQNHVLPEKEIQAHQEPSERDSSTPSADTELRSTPTQKENTGDVDYFEKFTLVDVVGSGERALELQEETEQLAAKPKEIDLKPSKETTMNDLSASEDSFVFVGDVDIVGEHLDEVFYGEGTHDETQHRKDGEAEEGVGRRMRRESLRSVKESGSALFGSEETILTPIFISPGPPKIIDPILLEEPTAMSFMYSDLYEDAVGERRKSEEEYSEAESVASEKSYKRRLSDSEEADGYLEKFILKDETPTLELHSDFVENKTEGRIMWSQNEFEMTGCLIRVVNEKDEKVVTPKTQETTVGDRGEDLKPVVFEVKRQTDTDKEKEREEIELSVVAEEKTIIKASEETIQESELKEDEIEDKQSEPPDDDSTNEAVLQQVDSKGHKTVHQSEALEKTPITTEPEQLCVLETAQAANEKYLPEEAATDNEIVSADEKVITKVMTIAPAEAPAETSLCEINVVREDVAPVEVITACDSAVQAVVEIFEKEVDEKEMQTQVQIDLQELQGAETTDIKTAAAPEEECEAPTEETTVENQMLKSLPEADEESHVETEITNQSIKTLMPEEINVDSEKKQDEILESKQNQQEELKNSGQSEKTTLTPESKDETLTEDAGTSVCDTVNVGDELILFVPKGQTVEMDIEVNQLSEKIIDTSAFSEPHSTCEHPIVSETPTIYPEAPQEPNEEMMAEPKGFEEKSEPLRKETALPRNELDDRYSLLCTPLEEANTEDQKEEWKIGEDVPLEEANTEDQKVEWKLDEDAPLEEANTEDQKVEWKLGEDAHLEEANTEDQKVEWKLDEDARLEEANTEDQKEEWKLGEDGPVDETNTEDKKMKWKLDEDEGFFSRLRSFTPQEDLSGLQEQDLQLEAADSEQRTEMQQLEDAVLGLPDLHKQGVEQKMEHLAAVTEAPEVTAEELQYEVVSEEDAKEMMEPKTQTDTEEPKLELVQKKEEIIEMAKKMEEEEEVFDLSPEEDVIEADYDIIDAEEERQARLAAELEGLNWYCLNCRCLLSEDDCRSGEHHEHDVTTVDKAYEEIKEKLSDWISELQGRSENIEDLVSELELAYNSIEDQCVETDAAMQVQNEEMMALVMEQYNNMSISLEEEKKAKLEQLYDQIVSFQESIDSTKATLETTAREAETDARSPEDIQSRLKEALDSVMSLELGPKGLLVFEDYAKGNTSSSHLAQRKGIPVPQRPTLQPQEPCSATSTSVTVYWNVNPGDIIDCFQVYCMEEPQGVSEEYRVTVKESYCVLEELEPDKTYKVWVMAVNYTGCSLPSERLAFRTAPSVPVIDTELCTVMGDSATLRWSSTKMTSKQSYTLEYCRQYELEGEGLRCITGIKSCEQSVLLQPDENYLFYIKAVNEAGASEQSEAALISTKGTKFHLLKASAHPPLELSVDQTTLHYSHDASENSSSTDKQCPSILGELLPAGGLYYWETVVSGSTAYRLGVVLSTANRNIPLGENSLSWCLQCTPTPSGCRYQLLHNETQATLLVTEMPERVGTLLDYQLGHLSFYNAHSGQLLGRFSQRFTQQCHPALALELPGSLEVRMVSEVPEFTKDC